MARGARFREVDSPRTILAHLRAMPGTTHERGKLLLVKGIEGLGNRMLCALTGILYARLTGRTLFVDWGDFFYSNDGSNAFPRFFRCSSCAPASEIPQTDSVHPSIWRGRLRESACL